MGLNGGRQGLVARQRQGAFTRQHRHPAEPQHGPGPSLRLLLVELLTGHVRTLPRHAGSLVRPDLKPDPVVLNEGATLFWLVGTGANPIANH